MDMKELPLDSVMSVSIDTDKTRQNITQITILLLHTITRIQDVLARYKNDKWLNHILIQYITPTDTCRMIQMPTINLTKHSQQIQYTLPSKDSHTMSFECCEQEVIIQEFSITIQYPMQFVLGNNVTYSMKITEKLSQTLKISSDFSSQ